MNIKANSMSKKNKPKVNEDWFNSDYYHILYKNRDYQEAQSFSKKLMNYLSFDKKIKILDLACGRGRHSVFFNKLGNNVTGVDISSNNIREAKKNENKSLKFHIHDMRLPMNMKFDLVVNLFTSFGYFDNDMDNLKTLISLKKNLADNGFGVVDFFNIGYLNNNLVNENFEVIESIKFKLKRYIHNSFLIKEIYFNHNDQNYNFKEKVKALSLNDFKSLFEQANLKIVDIFGDYHLNKFDIINSQRLIFIVQ